MVSDSHSDFEPKVGILAECAVCDFLRDAVSRLADVLKNAPQEYLDETRWERSRDGHFRERKIQRWVVPIVQRDELLHSFPSYRICVDILKSDAVIGRHFDCMVGTRMCLTRFDPDVIFNSLISAMVDNQGYLIFSEDKFKSKWQEWVVFFETREIAAKMVAPLPNLFLPRYPLRLNNSLVLDRLTDDEVTWCCRLGVIRPSSSTFPLIYDTVAVGVRKTILLPKLISQDGREMLPMTVEEGTFGLRPPFQDDIALGDVLSALRLYKHAQIRAAGFASLVDSILFGTTFSYRELGRWPYGGRYELSEDDIPEFIKLWKLLEDGAIKFGFSINRFNLAFDRGTQDDRIVDLVIASEGLFLGDIGDKRGELGFRSALRAAKFIDHPSYCEQDIFDIMRKAYDIRSAIVHGNSQKKTKNIHLPGNAAPDLPIFMDAFEELMRLALRKALSVSKEGLNLKDPKYWEALLFSKASK